MGERKGVNKYYPPDYDPGKGGLNKFQGTHALRERARKLHMGILIIRFEMPYNIWCEGCEKHIGMGVRYNAEKKKVGMYYSTPIYQFRMKCHLCTNHFEIKTDPANLDYVIVSGARRQERRWDPKQNEQVVPEEKATSCKLATDAMFRLEHSSEDSGHAKKVAPVLANLESLQGRWKDDYMANRILRDGLRSRKKEQKSIQEKDDELLKKSSLDIALVPESEEDKQVASLLRLAPTKSFEERQKQLRQEIESRPLFGSSPAEGIKEKILRAKRESVGNARSSLTRSSLGVTLPKETIGSKHEQNSAENEKRDIQDSCDLSVKMSSLVSSDYATSSDEETFWYSTVRQRTVQIVVEMILGFFLSFLAIVAAENTATIQLKSVTGKDGWDIFADLTRDILGSHLPKCSLSIAYDTDTLSSSLLGLLLEVSSDYRIGAVVKMTNFTRKWNDFPGLSSEEDLFNFRTMPSELKSQHFIGPCTLHLVIAKSSQSLKKLVTHLATSLRVRNLSDHFVFWMDSFGREVLLEPPASGISFQMGVSVVPGTNGRRLKIQSVCFFCNNGESTLTTTGYFPGNLSHVDPFRRYSFLESNVKHMRILLLEEIDSADIASKAKTLGLSSLQPHLRCLYEMSEFYHFTWEAILPEVSGDHGLDVTRLPNGTWVGSTGALLNGKADMVLSPLLNLEAFRLFEAVYPVVYLNSAFVTRRPQHLIRWDALFKAFEVSVWFLTFSLIAISSIVLALVMTSEARITKGKAAFYVERVVRYIIRCMIDQPYELRVENAGCIFVTFVWFFVIIMTTAYKSKLVSLLASPSLKSVPESFPELFQSNYTYGIDLVLSVIIDIALSEILTSEWQQLPKKCKIFPTIAACAENCLYERQFACISTDYALKFETLAIAAMSGQKELTLSTKNGFWIFTTPVFPSDAVFMERLGFSLPKFIMEAGFWDQHVKDHMFFNLLKGMRRQKAGTRRDFIVKDNFSMSNLFAPFLLLGIGSLVNIVVFALEVFLTKKQCT